MDFPCDTFQLQKHQCMKVFVIFPVTKSKKTQQQIRKLLTLHSDAFLWPVFYLSGEDSTGPHTNDIVSQVELQRVETKHFNPEKSNFHRRVRALKHQRNLQENTSDSKYFQALVKIVDKRPYYACLSSRTKPHTYITTSSQKLCLPDFFVFETFILLILHFSFSLMRIRESIFHSVTICCVLVAF